MLNPTTFLVMILAVFLSVYSPVSYSKNEVKAKNDSNTKHTQKQNVRISKLETKQLGNYGKMIPTNPSGSQHITQTNVNAAKGEGAHVTTQQSGASARDYFDKNGKYKGSELKIPKQIKGGAKKIEKIVEKIPPKTKEIAVKTLENTPKIAQGVAPNVVRATLPQVYIPPQKFFENKVMSPYSPYNQPHAY